MIEMAYSISFSPQTVKVLEDLDRFVRKKLIATIEKLERRSTGNTDMLFSKLVLFSGT